MARLSVTASPYVMLTKPGIIMGNAITTTGGFILASRGGFNPWLFLAALLGLSLIIASACILNNYMDRHIDERMKRTQNRGFVQGNVSVKLAFLIAAVTGITGCTILILFTNLLTLSLALVGFLVYVILYTLSKVRTAHGTLIGSIAGAVPPIVGYSAASGQFDTGALVFFILLALWQMPHFYAISIYRIEDYAAAKIPVLPLKKGIQATKIHMLFYILAFTGVSSLLTFLGYAGPFFLMTTTLLGLSWFALGLKGLKAKNDPAWARQMFIFSLVVIMGVCFAIPFSIAF